MKKQLEFALLVFAITTLLWCTAFAFIIGNIDKEYKNNIKRLELKLKNK